jgi:hypothetical protein
MFVACAVSLSCHLVAVTLLAGRAPSAYVPAPFDGVITVIPDATAEPAGDQTAPPPARTESRAPRARSPWLGHAPRRPRPRPVGALRPPEPKAEQPIPPPTAPRPIAHTGAGVTSTARPTPAPVVLDAGVARGLRIYDVFPRMPETLRQAPHAESIRAEICVSEQGKVRDVRLRGGSTLLENTVRPALLTWRYRPYLVNGTPTPFCHHLRLNYSAD